MPQSSESVSLAHVKVDFARSLARESKKTSDKFLFDNLEGHCSFRQVLDAAGVGLAGVQVTGHVEAHLKTGGKQNWYLFYFSLFLFSFSINNPKLSLRCVVCGVGMQVC